MRFHWQAPAAATAAGLLMAAPILLSPLWLLAFVGLALFFRLVDRSPTLRGALVLGAFAGAAYMSALFYWINYTIVVYGGLHPVFSALMFAGYVMVFGTKLPFLALLGFLMRRHARLTPVLTWPLAVVAADVLQFSLFPSYFGDTQGGNLYFMQAADLIGARGLSFFVALPAAVAAEMWRRRHEGARLDLRPAAATLAVFSTLYGYGVARYHQVEDLMRRARTIRAALIQPVTPLQMNGDPRQIMNCLRTCDQLSLAAARSAGGPLDLLVWPEGGTPFSYGGNDPYDQMFTRLVQTVAHGLHTNMLFYDLLFQGPEPYNNVWLLDRKALPRGSYQKIMLLAFGEYVPGADSIPALRGFGGVVQHKRGNRIHDLSCDAGVIAPQICYEILFPDFTRKFVGQGADLIANLTNDAWFGPTLETYVHLALAYPRAIENRVPMIRCTNSGTSVVIAPSGRFLTTPTPLFQAVYQVAQIPLAPIGSCYTRHGDWFAWACVLAVAALLGQGLLKKPSLPRNRVF